MGDSFTFSLASFHACGAASIVTDIREIDFRITKLKALRHASAAGLSGFIAVQRLLGKLNTAPSRTPADGQRCVMVLRLV